MNGKGEKLLKYPLEILSWFGQNPEQSNQIKYGLVAFLFLLCGITAAATILIQFFYIKGNITAIAENCEATAVYIQFICKILVSFVKNKNFREMIKDTKNFSEFRSCLTRTQIDLEEVLGKTLLLEKFFVFLIILGAVFFNLIAVSEKQLPSGVWILTEYNQLYSFVLVFHICFLLPVTLYVACFDCLFLSFCINLKTQYKMLNCLLKDLGAACSSDEEEEKRFFSRLRSYVQYHDFLLRYSRNLQTTYSPILLTEYSSLLLLLVGEMYVLLESTDTIQSPRYAFAMAAVLMQLSFYCIPLNYVTDEAISVSQGIFGSDWHSNHIPTLKAAVLLVIQRSQREIVFTAGGLFEVNCRTLPSVVRTSYSICMILRAIKKI